jgi:predicted PurR-regulated permease PerM
VGLWAEAAPQVWECVAMNRTQALEDRTSPWRDRLGRAAVRSVQTLLVLTLAAAAVWAGVQLRLLVVPLLIATLIAAAASPVVARLVRLGLPRALAVWLALLAGFAVIGGGAYFVGSAALSQWDGLSERADDGIAELERFLAQPPLGLDRDQLEELRAMALQLVSGPSGMGGATLVFEIVTGVFLGLVLLYFLLKDGERIWAFLRTEVLPEKHSERFDLIAARTVEVLGGYVRGTALVALVEAVLIGVTIAVLGVPLALPLAVVVFVGAFVPLIGATTAGTLAAVVALLANGPGTALIVVGVVVLVNQLEGDFLSPVVLGKVLSLHPLAVLMALTAGTITAGITGAILSVPFAAVAWSAITTWRETEDDESSVQSLDAGAREPEPV